ncbi:MAG: hypothetical protein PHR77_03035 [Kiritimatiellae bacterium]|nr:hypothetical protein [Kiritimatiellia bacterium]MDD5521040.1 hypothetical protein [Kiritimatiellia bacterium]
MKRLIILAASCSLITILGHAADDTTAQAKPETYFIVKYFDHAKMLSYKLVSQTEYKALLEEIAGESKIWDKTMAASEKAWKAEGSTTKKFPRSAISQKKVMIVDKFTDQEKATARLNNMEQALAEAEEARQKNIEEQQKKLSKIMGNRKIDDKGTSDREAFLESARSLFNSKLSELSGGTLGSQESAAPAAEDKEKDKEKEKDKKAGDKK